MGLRFGFGFGSGFGLGLGLGFGLGWGRPVVCEAEEQAPQGPHVHRQPDALAAVRVEHLGRAVPRGGVPRGRGRGQR